MTPTITTTLPAPTPMPTGDTGSTPLAALFADFLNPGSALTDNAAPLPEDAQDHLQDIALTPAEEPVPDTDLPEDLPWPPEGLASLWLPAAPAPVSLGAASMTGSAAPSPATATADENARIIPSASVPIHHPTGTDMALPESITPESGTSHFLPPSGDANPAEIAQTSISVKDGQNTAAAPFLSVPAALPSPESESISIQAPALEARLPTADPTPSGGEVLQNDPPPAPSMSALPPAAPRIPAPAPAQPAPATAPFPAPELHADNFPDAVGTHIQWLAEHKIGHAHLQLTPQDMGPLEVRLKLDGDQLQAHFTSAEPDVRQALEHALPRLRELLGEHGLNLGQADIGQQPSRQHTSPSPHTEASSSTRYADDTPAPDAPTQHVHSAHLVDTYA